MDDILEDRDYMEWRELISQLNNEYDDRYEYSRSYDERDCISCRKCGISLWNYRMRWPGCTKFNGILHILECPLNASYRNPMAHHFKLLNIILPKNC